MTALILQKNMQFTIIGRFLNFHDMKGDMKGVNSHISVCQYRAKIRSVQFLNFSIPQYYSLLWTPKSNILLKK